MLHLVEKETMIWHLATELMEWTLLPTETLQTSPTCSKNAIYRSVDAAGCAGHTVILEQENNL